MRISHTQRKDSFIYKIDQVLANGIAEKLTSRNQQPANLGTRMHNPRQEYRSHVPSYHRCRQCLQTSDVHDGLATMQATP